MVYEDDFLGSFINEEEEIPEEEGTPEKEGEETEEDLDEGFEE